MQNIPSTMFTNIIFLALAVAGIGMMWRRILKDSPRLQNILRDHMPRLVFGALDCPFCFTFWTSLAVVLITSPLQELVRGPVQIVLLWMALGTVSIFVRAVTEQLFRLSGYVLRKYE
jgi:hypothetical protein